MGKKTVVLLGVVVTLFSPSTVFQIVWIWDVQPVGMYRAAIQLYFMAT